MPLRVVAVSAPDWISGAKGEQALNSQDPVSLFNACRYAAELAQTSLESAWAKSNWACDRAVLRRKFQLMYSLDDIERFETLLIAEQPNVLLLGAMSICMPGAIECARRARLLLGDNVKIILGGRHVCETIFLPSKAPRHNSAVQHHPASPLLLVTEGKIPDLFDAVISGDGEIVIAELGELISAECIEDVSASSFRRALERLNPSTPGDWIVGWVNHSGGIQTLVSDNVPIPYNKLPSPAKIFGVSAAFDVFGGRKTAHIFSDIGRGCVYDCTFCSERISVTGGIRDMGSAADRLHRQLQEAYEVIAHDHPGQGASAFVEDSVFLGGSPKLISRFIDLREAFPTDIVFGAQFTIDQIIRSREIILRLRDVGLRYIFVGIETLSPDEIGGMSKDVGRNRRSWLDRIEDVLGFLTEARIQCGCAILFGLGEPLESRIALLEALSDLRSRFNAPEPVSVNWAVQHPLQGTAGAENYNYVDWGTPKGRMLEIFHGFGEASSRYPLREIGPPVLTEMETLNMELEKLWRGSSVDGRKNAALSDVIAL